MHPETKTLLLANLKLTRQSDNGASAIVALHAESGIEYIDEEKVFIIKWGDKYTIKRAGFSVPDKLSLKYLPEKRNDELIKILTAPIKGRFLKYYNSFQLPVLVKYVKDFGTSDEYEVFIKNVGRFLASGDIWVEKFLEEWKSLNIGEYPYSEYIKDGIIHTSNNGLATHWEFQNIPHILQAIIKYHIDIRNTSLGQFIQQAPDKTLFYNHLAPYYTQIKKMFSLMNNIPDRTISSTLSNL